MSFLMSLLLMADLFSFNAIHPSKPNIVFILADDLGIANLGCYGADHAKTPNIDSLARGGTRYSYAYTPPLCGPSRAVIMTGRYGFRTGATNQDATGNMKTTVETMIPKVLKSAGYKSAMVGKWGQLPLSPSDWGFDDSLRFRGSGVYWGSNDGTENYFVNEVRKKLDAKSYMPDLMHDHAVEFMRKNRANPFFLFYSLSHVHGELARTPDSSPETKDLLGDNIAYMDKLVGKLVTELDNLKLRDKTLIVFFGDNGTGKGQAKFSTIQGKRLAGEKGTMQEGGTHVPMVLNWQGVVEAGKVSKDLVDSSDFLPTFAELAGASLPKTILDGKSFAKNLSGQSELVRDSVFVQLAKMWFVQDTRWKLNHAGELFEMTYAPFEEKLVPENSSELESKQARNRLQAKLNQLNPAAGIVDDGDGTGRHGNKKKKIAGNETNAKGSVAIQASKSPSPSKPNVLFIAVDDLRPEMGCYGNKVVKTPNLDRLASRGMIFNRAYCQQAVCSPSRTSLMTGRRPDATKVWDLVTHFRDALPDTITLPQHFKSNGYHTAALSKIYHKGYEDGRSWSEPHWYPNGQTVDTDPMDSTKRTVKKYGPGVDAKENDGGGKGPAFEVSGKSDDELPDGFTAAEAVKRLHSLKDGGKPFFLAVGFLKPHLPFIAPKKYWDLYNPETIPLPAIEKLPQGAPEFAGHINGELHSYNNVPKGNPLPDSFARKLRHGYYACISYTDAQVGRLLDALEKEGLADNTIVVLWGDHGWQLGDHGLWHKHTNFELASRAPLMISVPGQKTAGKACNFPVEFVDVYPTLADLCGLSVPNGLDGASLKPQILNPETPTSKVAISQYPRSAGKAGGSVMGYSIRDERWRLTIWRERNGSKVIATELYDEVNDPAETVSVHQKPENKQVVDRLSKYLPPTGSKPPASQPKKKKTGKED